VNALEPAATSRANPGAGVPAAIVCRYAPTPSGDLHLGNMAAAVSAWLFTRAHAGRFLIRVDDLDRLREAPGAAARILQDLARFGLDWDGPVVFQSARVGEYRAALDRLIADGRAYPCFCSRTDIRKAIEAQGGRLPGDNEEAVYPGTCRAIPPDEAWARGRTAPHAVRFRAVGRVAFDDLFAGAVTQDLEAEAGDFVLWRRDGVPAYHLATAVDEIALGITHIVRGADLLPSTPRQIALIEALGGTAPTYGHLPVIRGDDGLKLSKRDGSLSVRTALSSGRTVEDLVGDIAFRTGLTATAAPTTVRTLLEGVRQAPST
jgi:glutamyl-queuosine tRNA(Asp) synthetase